MEERLSKHPDVKQAASGHIKRANLQLEAVRTDPEPACASKGHRKVSLLPIALCYSGGGSSPLEFGHSPSRAGLSCMSVFRV